MTDTNNGCVSIDSATVALDANAPIADAGPAALLNCFAPMRCWMGRASSPGRGLFMNGLWVAWCLGRV
ncbi:MAG: hypothetical protein IPH04_10695 [Saprospirales bacterium]|nr:hypothetical protein [Saprospirales bacterium]